MSKSKIKITDAQIAAAKQADKDGRWFSNLYRPPDDQTIRSMLRAASATSAAENNHR